MMRLFLFCSALFFSFSASASLPSFANGYMQTFTVCQNSSASSINTLMAINDADVGETETWTIFSAPSHGVLSGFSTSEISTGGTVVPTSPLNYTPTTGYFGTDTFVIQIFDGMDTSTTTVVVTVTKLPILNSGLSPASICDGSVFNYTPTSLTPGATFSWSRPFIGGISNPAATGTGNPMETLISATYYNIAVTYNYTIVATGCTNHQNVVVTVKPTPRLSSATTAGSVCSGGTFNYAPTSATVGTTYSWTRAAVAGITPSTGSGVGNISESLTNSTLTSLNAVYAISLDANGCSSSRNVFVTVDPQPAITAIGTKSAASVCVGTNNQVFGAGVAPPAGVTYSWTAVNATISATGSNGQFSIVNFPNAGTAVIKLHISVGASGCKSSDTVAVNVGPSSVAPSAKVLYYNGQFIYMDNNIDAYQWGYDNASTFASSNIEGANFQSYPNSAPDMTNRYYWVKTTKGSCTQKTYYNAPLAITNVTTGNAATLVVYPNPASNTLSVEVNGTHGNVVEVVVTDMLGHAIKKQSGVAHAMQFDVNDMPAGCYLVSCSENGVKLATARFIKN